MNIRFIALAGLMATSCFGQIVGFGLNPPAAAIAPNVYKIDAFQIRYAANLAVGDSVINLTNDGSSSTDAGVSGGAQNGDICANIYAYSPDEQLVSCCSCNVTPNGLNSLSVRNDLASNTLTPIIPSALVVKIVSTVGGARCTASTPATLSVDQAGVIPTGTGLHAWGTTIHALPVTSGTPATTYGVTETPFSFPSAVIGSNQFRGFASLVELNRMSQLCAFIRANGSGYGICKSCKVGGLGASAK